MTTNIQLIDMARALEIPNFHCVMKDELASIRVQLPLNVVLNLESSDRDGSHWCLLHVSDSSKIYYSSFGDSICNEAKALLLGIDAHRILTSDFQVQKLSESTCGLYCILILFLLNNVGLQFEDIILSL